MSNIPAIFNFNTHEVRTIIKDGAPWFIATDITSALEYRDASAGTRWLDDDEKGTHTVSTRGGDQEMTIISESGMYSMIMHSRKASAKTFRKWVTSEVLPSIRKTGRYEANPLGNEDSAAISTVRDREPLLYAAVAIVVKHHLKFSTVYSTMNHFAGSMRFAVMTKAQVAEVAQFVERFLLGTDTRNDWVQIEANRKAIAGDDPQHPLTGFGFLPVE